MLLLVLQVRMAIAAQLHVMAKKVSPSDAARLLRRPLSALLRDASPLVREALLAGLADTLQVSWCCCAGPQHLMLADKLLYHRVNLAGRCFLL
jgi:hypothetical protein